MRSRRSGNSILGPNLTILPEWLELMEEFPDRFVMGTDMFYGANPVDEKGLNLQVGFLKQLPADLAEATATENAKRLYQLD